jgi:hypothetical protein
MPATVERISKNRVRVTDRGASGVENPGLEEVKKELVDLPWAGFTDPKKHNDNRYTYVIVPVPIDNVFSEDILTPRGTMVTEGEEGLYLEYSELKILIDDILSISSLITEGKTPTKVNEYHTQVGYIVEPKGGDIEKAIPKSHFSPEPTGIIKRVLNIFDMRKISPQHLLNATEEGSYNRVQFKFDKEVKVTGLYFNAQLKPYENDEVYKALLERQNDSLPLVVLNKPELLVEV